MQQRRGDSLGQRSHDRLRSDRLTGVIELALVTKDPLHVGSGVHTVMDGRTGPELIRGLMVNCRDGEGLPIIPGGSLKGVVRCLVEVLAGGCDLVQGCGRCFTCSLFGFAGGRGESFAARVGFQDFEAAEDVLMQVERLPMPRRPQQSKGRRLYSQPEHPSTGETPYDTVAPGETLRGCMHITNITEVELGLVLLAMGCDGSFSLRLGGGKFAGLGRVHCSVEGARLRNGYQSPTPTVLARDAAAELARRTMDRASANLDEAGRAALETVRRTHQDRPSGGA